MLVTCLCVRSLGASLAELSELSYVERVQLLRRADFVVGARSLAFVRELSLYVCVYVELRARANVCVCVWASERASE